MGQREYDESCNQGSPDVCGPDPRGLPCCRHYSSNNHATGYRWFYAGLPGRTKRITEDKVKEPGRGVIRSSALSLSLPLFTFWSLPLLSSPHTPYYSILTLQYMFYLYYYIILLYIIYYFTGFTCFTLSLGLQSCTGFVGLQCFLGCLGLQGLQGFLGYYGIMR